MDELDTKLVRLLQSDGRMPVAVLARRLGMTRLATSRRLDKLLAGGTVSVGAVRNRATRQGYEAAHLDIKIRGDVSGLTARLVACPTTEFVSLTSGSFGIIAEIYADDLPSLRNRVEELRHVAGVQAIRTLVFTEIVRHVIAPSGRPTFEPDAIDLRLIGLLEEDGRRSYAELSTQVGLSANATRSRLMRLLEGQVMRVATYVNPRVDDAELSVGIAVATNEDEAALIVQLDAMPEVEFLARVLGDYNILLTVRTASRGQLTDLVEMLWSHSAVIDLNSWLHLDVVKDVGMDPSSARTRRNRSS